MSLKEKPNGIQENIPLARHTTFKIGGEARYFFVAQTKDDLISAVRFAKENKLPFLVLGGGSNVLAKDQGFKGIVVKIQISESKCLNSVIFAGAGTSLCELVLLAAKNSLTGLEWAAGIPGTVGGAVLGNASAFWFAISDSVLEVEVLDARSLKIKKMAAEKCAFSHKNSIFKKNKNLIILSVVIKLKKGDAKKIEEKIQEYLNYRRERHPLNFPSAGCVFKNYIPEIKNPALLKKFPKILAFNKKGRIPAAFLIEECGLKGKKIGKAQFSEKHANFVINLGGAKAKDVLKLINLAKQKVKNKFGVKLEEEIQYIF